MGRKGSVRADIAGDLTELAIPVTTDPARLAQELSKPVPGDAMQVVFSTYQSSPKIAEAQQRAAEGWGFDLIICDEAHRTTGIEESKEGLGVSPFRIVHDDAHIRGGKRLYMTATPRVFTARQRKKIEASGFEGDSYSMDDTATFGERFYEMEFSEAVEGGYLSDYEVLVITATEVAYMQSLANAGWSHEVLVHETTNLALDDAVKLAGCWDALATPATTEVLPGRFPGQIFADGGEPARSAIAFTNLVRTSQTAAMVWPKVVDALTRQKGNMVGDGRGKDFSEFLRLDVNHIDGATPAAERTDLLEQLRDVRAEGDGRPVCRILSNARVLTEGVDVPSLDAVIFLNSRTSTVDITQAVGRAMRTAPGKRKGYIIIPVVVPEDADPKKKLEASDFQTVWEVVRALRSHDSRMEYYVSNASAWAKNAPLRVCSFPVGPGVDEGNGKRVQQQLQFQLNQEIASKVVEIVGDKHMYPRWGERAADICRQVQIRINDLIAEGGLAEEAFGRFLKGIRQSVGDHVKIEQAQEMIAQHVVTIPVFEVMLAQSGFAEQNPVSKEIERLLSTFRELNVSFEEELRPLTRAYRQMEAAFTGAVSSAEKMDILRTIYEGFFQAAMKDTVKRVGIVYTPVQIVDFMVRSAAAICQKEFGRSIGSKNLHILDPFTGTGTFLARLIEMKDEDGNYLISPEDLDRKYKHELHANEFILLAYYIAALKIEEAKHSRDSETSEGEVEYQTCENIVLTDTLLSTPKQKALDTFRENIQGRYEQDRTPMTVILANPPWSAGVKQAGDDTTKLDYPAISGRVSDTYGAKHKEITGRGIGKAGGDLYIKSLRWCSDRILNGDHPAVIGLVHPNSFTDGPSLAGARAKVRDEFTSIYVVNLRGNAYKSGDEFRKEGDKLFGGGARSGVQITFLVRNPSKDNQFANLYYAQVPAYMNLDEKWNWLENIWDVTSSQLEEVPINPKHDWVNLSDGTFERLLPVCGVKKSKNIAVHSHALGLATNLDTYVYSFKREKLMIKVKRLIAAYNDALFQLEHHGDTIEEAVLVSPIGAIKWTGALKATLKKGKRLVFDERRIREVLYRPFTKLWLYEDDLILSSVRTISKMFPAERADEAISFSNSSGRGTSDTAFASDTISDLNSVRGGGQGFSRDGDSDSESVGDVGVRGAGGGSVAGSVREGSGATDEGGDAPEVTGGGGWGILVTCPSNKAVFGTLATGTIADLCGVGTQQACRVVPQRRRG